MHYDARVDLGQLIEQHGYWILALGCLMEGETVLVLAGFAAHRGYLDLAVVLVVGACAGFLGDQILFWIGRRHAEGFLRRFPSLASHAARAHRFLDRHPNSSIVGVRFAYGMRILGPLLIGASQVTSGRFLLLNALGAALWATCFVLLGWFFGQAAEALLGEITHVEGRLLAGLVVAGILVFLFRAWRRRRREGRAP